MFRKLNRPVPYAFRTWDGEIRSLDAGCLKFLANRVPPEVVFHCDALGFIDSVEPSTKLLGRYSAIKDALIKRLNVRNPLFSPLQACSNGSTPRELRGLAVAYAAHHGITPCIVRYRDFLHRAPRSAD
jgi:hypothetical protein